MGKTHINAPTGQGGGLFGGPKASKKALEALSVMFGTSLKDAKNGKGFSSIEDAQSFFEGLEDRFFDRAQDQLRESGDLAREQTALNQEQNLQFSRDAIQSLRDDPVLQELGFFDTEIDLGTISNQINAQRSARGLEGSAVDAAHTGIQTSLAGEGIRQNRMQLARSLFSGALPGLPGTGGTQAPGLFNQAPLTQPAGFNQAFGISAQLGGQNQGFNFDRAFGNAQFEQQFKNDLGSFFGSIAGSFGGGGMFG